MVLIDTDILALEAGFDVIVELRLHVTDTLHAPFGDVKFRRPITPSAIFTTSLFASRGGPFNR